MQARFSQEAWSKMCELHALPTGWEKMKYEEFLIQRRLLIAQIIRRGYEALN